MAEPRAHADAVFIIYVHNRPGVLAKVASIFHRRALNIGTLTVGTTHQPELSKMVVRVAGTGPKLERVAAAIRNLIDVLSVELCDSGALRAQELCLVRVAAGSHAERETVLAAAAPFAATLVDAAADSVVLEVAGTPVAIELLIAVLARFTVLDMSRTGVTAMPSRSAPNLGGAAGARGDQRAIAGPR